MFNTLFSALSGMVSFSSVVSWIQNLLMHFENDVKDPTIRTNAIDAVIEILQKAKNAKPPIVPPK
jgi:hypothetical protein